METSMRLRGCWRIGTRVALVVGAAAVAGGTLGVRSSPAAPAKPPWGLRQDFRVAPNQANPSPDRSGHAGVWSYWAAPEPGHPAGYRLLSRFLPDAFGVAGLQQWQGDETRGTLDGLPAVGVNVTGADQHPLGIVWRAGHVRAEPGRTRPSR
jgi:hypothetical protein